jgi:hypothetical protein
LIFDWRCASYGAQRLFVVHRSNHRKAKSPARGSAPGNQKSKIKNQE